MKRTLCLLLVFCFLIPSIASCAESTSNNDTETTQNTVSSPNDTSAEETEVSNEKILPNLPEKNYNDADFTIYVSSNAEYGQVKDDFTAEEITGEPINDSRYNRNSLIEETYGVKLNVIQASGLGDGVGTNEIKRSVTSADFAYDFAMLAGYSTCKLASQNILMDINKVPYINLEQPWWDQRANHDLTIMDKLYYTTGDISTADNEATYCIMFNKSLIQNYVMDDPYQMVSDGTWTIDNYAAMVTQVSDDLDGNGVYDTNDRFGALIWDDSIMGVINCSGEKCASVVDGKVELTLYSDKTVSILEKYFSFALDKQVSYAYQRSNWDDKLLVNMFQSNQALFIMQLLQLIPKLREMDADFGILPYFKYSEEQESYYNTVGSWHSVFYCVPKVQAEIERTGIITEALAAESMYTVTPAYYEVSLKDKISRDEESAKMLDLIFETRIYDLGWYYAFGGYNESVMNLFRNYQSDFTSMYKMAEKMAKKTVERLNKEFAEQDEENN